MEQALEVIRVLKEAIPLQRASMRLRVGLPVKEARRVREKILPHLTVQQEEWDRNQLCIVSNISLHVHPLSLSLSLSLCRSV